MQKSSGGQKMKFPGFKLSQNRLGRFGKEERRQMPEVN
jgi:hypothetical protein